MQGELQATPPVADLMPAPALKAVSTPLSYLPRFRKASLPLATAAGTPSHLHRLSQARLFWTSAQAAGLDCFFAAKKVGEAGKVIGVDMTPEMIERARSSAKRLNLNNVEFRQGYLEDLPVESDSVDVIISNCVINLSPDKSKVFAEAFRVLNSGGRLAVSDIVTDGPLPNAIKQSLSAWAGCVAGAVDAKDYIGLMEAVGFKNVSVTPVFFDKETVDSAISDLGNTIELKTISRDEVYKAVYSAKIIAYKP